MEKKQRESRVKDKAILSCHCKDKKGIVAMITTYLQSLNANILDLDQHVDRFHDLFFMRIEWDLEGYALPKEEVISDFKEKIASKIGMNFEINFASQKPKLAIMVSKSSHCLYDILQRYRSGEWQVEIPIVISNHEHFRDLVESHGIEFHYFKITKENKAQQEVKQINLLKKHNIDLVILARYMQILSENFVDQYPNKIINIHHSFLPAFVGAKPYHQAFERGVKLIGATSHYVTTELDAGPIIAQGVTRISHTDEVEDLKRKGKNLEKTTLSEAVWLHIQRRVLSYNNRTVVFA